MLGKTWFRVSILIAVCVAEIALWWILKTYGLITTSSVVWQILILLAATSPLLIAILILFGKQHRLSTLFVSLTLLAIFLGCVVTPVLEHRRSIRISKQLSTLGIQYSDFHRIGVPGQPPYRARQQQLSKLEQRKAVVQPPDWVRRLSGGFNGQVSDKNIRWLCFDSMTCSFAPSFVEQLPNCKSITLVGLGSLTLEDILKRLDESKIENIVLGSDTFGVATMVDIDFLEGNRNIKNLGLFEYANALDSISSIDFPNLSGICVHSRGNLLPPRNGWTAFFKSPNMQRVTALTFDCQLLTDAESKFIGELEQLESLALVNCENLSDWDFLLQLKNLKQLSIMNSNIDDSVLKKFESSKLEYLDLYSHNIKFHDTVESLQKALPNCHLRLEANEE